MRRPERATFLSPVLALFLLAQSTPTGLAAPQESKHHNGHLQALKEQETAAFSRLQKLSTLAASHTARLESARAVAQLKQDQKLFITGPRSIELAGEFYSRHRLVKTSAELRKALEQAMPGTLIELAPGVYRGPFTIDRSGLAEQAIALVGPRSAVLTGGSLIYGTALTVHAENWRLSGFTF